MNIRVVLTGGMNEEELISSLVSRMKTEPVNYTGKFSLSELAALYQKADVFVSNSTGPLHIAAMMGTPVVAFYPPIIQCSPTRWGPCTEKKKIYCGTSAQCSLCTGGPCRSNVCMDQITVEQVLGGIRELLNEKK